MCGVVKPLRVECGPEVVADCGHAAANRDVQVTGASRACSSVEHPEFCIVGGSRAG